MPLQSERIWLPDHFREQQERAVAQAVEEYDPDLSLGYRKDTGEWCAFLPGNRASDGQPFPVYSFGGELPTPDRAKKALYQHDIRRNGKELLDQLDRIYDDEQKRIADRTSEASEAVAEAIDSNMRLKGVHPFPRIHMSGKFGKDRVRSSG
jgi:hypothetical protein